MDKNVKELFDFYRNQDVDFSDKEEEAHGDLCDICCIGACDGCGQGFGCC